MSIVGAMRGFARTRSSQAHAESLTYDAFVSYNHTDDRIAVGIRSALHKFARPWYALRASNVCLDQASLSAAPDLWEEIRARLDQSRFLILLASSDAAASQWVAKEATHWVATPSRARRMIIAVTQGELAWDPDARDFDWAATTCLPKALAGVFRNEPLFVDLRWARDAPQLSLRDDRFLSAIATIAATLHGVDKDTMVGEDHRQHARTRRVATAVAALVGCLTVGVSIAALLAVQARNEARDQRDTAISRQLATSAESQLTTDPELSVILSSQAAGRRLTTEADVALREALARSHVRRTLPLTAALDLVPGSLDDYPLDARFVADGTSVLAVSSNGTHALWTSDPAVPARKAASGMVTNDSVVSPDGAEIATVGWDRVEVRDARTLELLARIPGDGASFVVQGPSRHGAVAVNDGGTTLRFWSRARRGVVRRYRLPDLRDPEPVTARAKDALPSEPHLVEEQQQHATTSPDGHRVAILASSGALALLGLPDLRVILNIKARGFSYRSQVREPFIAFAPNGRFVYAPRQGPVEVRAVTSGRLITTLQGSLNNTSSRAVVSPDGRRVALDGFPGPLALWDLGSGHRVATLGDNISGFSPDSRLLVTAGGHTARVFEADSGSLLGVLRGHEGVVRAASFDSTSTHVITTSLDGTARIWAIPERRPAFRVIAAPNSSSVSPDGNWIAAAPEGSARIGVWSSTGSGRPRWRAKVGTDSVTAFSGDSRRVAARGAALRVWDIQSGRQLSPDLKTGHGRSDRVALDESGSRVAMAGSDGHVRIWDVASGELVAQFDTPEADEIAFTPDGSTLFTVGVFGSLNGKPVFVHVWRNGSKRIAKLPAPG